MKHNVGDKVIILRKDIHHLKKRKRPVYGIITDIDGSLILVRPIHCTWEIELYPNEIEAVRKK